MSPPPALADNRRMVITISIDEPEPPAGRARIDDGSELAFSGWLGLLKALSELLTTRRRP